MTYPDATPSDPTPRAKRPDQKSVEHVAALLTRTLETHPEHPESTACDVCRMMRAFGAVVRLVNAWAAIDPDDDEAAQRVWDGKVIIGTASRAANDA